MPLEERMERKKKREEMAEKMLKEKGDKMSRGDRAFIETFAKKDKCMKDKK